MIGLELKLSGRGTKPVTSRSRLGKGEEREGGRAPCSSLNQLLPELSHLARPEQSSGSLLSRFCLLASSQSGMATPGDLAGPELPACVSELSPHWMDDLGQVADSNFIRVSFLPLHKNGLVDLGARR